MSPRTESPPPDPSAPILAFDTGSPQVSVALVQDGRTLGESALPQTEASRGLLRRVDDLLRAAHLPLDQVGGLVALQGPGSFTGLRVGLATVLGLHQATGVPATALSTLAVLASTVPEAPGPVLAVVDALRGDWSAQRFDPGEIPEPLDEAGRRNADELARSGAATVVGFGLEALRGHEAWPAATRFVTPAPLAAAAARYAARAPAEWQLERLTQPHYFRAPAATLPNRTWAEL